MSTRPPVEGAVALEWSPVDDDELVGSISAMMTHDVVTGVVYVQLQQGDVVCRYRPATVLPFAAELLRLAALYEGCRWDVDANVCGSPTCQLTGPLHGRGRSL